VLKSYGGNLTSGDGVEHYGSSDEDYSDDEEEGEESYKPGGYHPVNIGDKYHNGRYTVIEKLGWGHFSTVWMCYDKKKSTPEDPSFVAMKIQKSASHYREAALDEVELLSNLNDTVNSSAVLAENLYHHENYCVRLVDHFEHLGPHGKHVCMVFEMLGENLLKIIKKYEYRGIPIQVVKSFARQICAGLDYMHRHCQIIHTDLKPENVLVAIAPKPSDLEKVMSLVGDGTSTTSKKGKLKKMKSADVGELTEAVDKMNFDSNNNTADNSMKLSSDQKKKLKKKNKKKKEKKKKEELKKRGSRKLTSTRSHTETTNHSSSNPNQSHRPPSSSSNNTPQITEFDKEQEKLEMMLMERDSIPKSELVPLTSESGNHVVVHNHDNMVAHTHHHHAHKLEEGKDAVDLKSDEGLEDTVERIRTLRLSSLMHLNFDSPLELPEKKRASSSSMLPIEIKMISKETYIPPPRPFLASIPMVILFFSNLNLFVNISSFIGNHSRKYNEASRHAEEYGFR
jgi:serine/threonine protein kinase